jgi:Ankyrin repeats (3 copies)/Ankyrin repeat
MVDVEADPTTDTMTTMVQSPQRGQHPLLWGAALLGNVRGVRELLEKGAEVDEEGVFIPDEPLLYPSQLHKTTALQVACMGNRTEIVQMLLEHGASVSFTGDTEKTALYYAARAGCFESVKLLLEHKADVYFEDDDGCTALHVAILTKKASADMLRVLIEHGSNVCTKNRYGFSPMDACYRLCSTAQAVMKAEVVNREKCVAFAMCSNQRLAVWSDTKGLHPEVLKMILARV